MQFTLLITSAPHTAVAAKALDFARALLRQQQQITRVFFFAEGVMNALPDSPLATEWQALMHQHQVPITVCSGSAAQHGIDSRCALLPVAGMGDWLMATLASDRLVSF